jgi:hypothetical protein
MRRNCELFVPRVKLPRPPSAEKLGQDRTVLVPTHPFSVEKSIVIAFLIIIFHLEKTENKSSSSSSY